MILKIDNNISSYKTSITKLILWLLLRQQQIDDTHAAEFGSFLYNLGYISIHVEQTRERMNQRKLRSTLKYFILLTRALQKICAT